MLRSPRPRLWLLAAGALVLGTTAIADNRVVVNVSLAFTSDAEIRPQGGAMKMTLTIDGAFVMTPGELVIARPLGTDLGGTNREWYDWRRSFADPKGGGTMETVRLDIYAPPVGKGALIRSLYLENAWPQAYKVVQLDEPALSPGGKATTLFEEILVIKFRRVLRSLPPP